MFSTFKAHRVTALALIALVPIAAADEPTPLADPIAATIAKGDIRVAVVPFLRAGADDHRPGAAGRHEQGPCAAPVLEAVPRRVGSSRIQRRAGPAVRRPRRRQFGEHVPRLANARRRLLQRGLPQRVRPPGFAFHPDFANAGKPGFGKLYVGFSGAKKAADDAPANPLNDLYQWPPGERDQRVDHGRPERQRLRRHDAGASARAPVLAYPQCRHAWPSTRPPPRVRPTTACSTPASVMAAAPTTPMSTGRTRRPCSARSFASTRSEAKARRPTESPATTRSSTTRTRSRRFGRTAYATRSTSRGGPDGRMYINDIGQDQVEEVNLGVAGGNYGWRIREGTFATAYGLGAMRIGPWSTRCPRTTGRSSTRWRSTTTAKATRSAAATCLPG